MATTDYDFLTLNEKDWKNIYGKLSKKSLVDTICGFKKSLIDTEAERDALKEINEHYEANFKIQRDSWEKQMSDLKDEVETYKHLAKEAHSELRRQSSCIHL